MFRIRKDPVFFADPDPDLTYTGNKALSPEEQGDPQQHDDMLPVLALRQSHPLSQHIQHQYKEQQVILKTNSDLKKPARKTAKSTEKLEIQLPPNLDEKKSSSCLQSCEIFKIFILTWFPS